MLKTDSNENSRAYLQRKFFKLKSEIENKGEGSERDEEWLDERILEVWKGLVEAKRLLWGRVPEQLGREDYFNLIEEYVPKFVYLQRRIRDSLIKIN